MVEVGGLYRTTDAFFAYDEDENMADAFTNLGRIIPPGQLLLCTGTGLPRCFLLVSENVKVFSFRVANVKLLSLPQVPTS